MIWNDLKNVFFNYLSCLALWMILKKTMTIFLILVNAAIVYV